MSQVQWSVEKLAINSQFTILGKIFSDKLYVTPDIFIPSIFMKTTFF